MQKCKMIQMAKYNWKTIEIQFTRGTKKEDGTKQWPTLQELSEEHKIPRGTIDSTASRKNWQEKKERYQKKVQEKVDEKKSQIEASEIVEDDLLCESFGRKALKVAEKKLDKLNELLDIDKWVSGIDILNTISAGNKAQEMIKTAQGDNAKRIKIESNSNDELLKDPDYIQAKKKAMDDYYANQKGGTD